MGYSLPSFQEQEALGKGLWKFGEGENALTRAEPGATAGEPM